MSIVNNVTLCAENAILVTKRILYIMINDISTL